MGVGAFVIGLSKISSFLISSHIVSISLDIRAQKTIQKYIVSE